jgi:acyl carrier protein
LSGRLRAIVNVVLSSKFSSDRAIRECARDIWGAETYFVGQAWPVGQCNGSEAQPLLLSVIGNSSRREQTILAPKEIDARVKRVLVEALGVDEDEVKPSATLQGDLGAESIDFLDIVLRLEREFRIRIPRADLFPGPASPDDPAFPRDGRLTDEGLAALPSRMPYADLADSERDDRPSRIEDLYTVGLLSSYIRWRLGDGRVDGDLPAPCVEAMDITPR